MEILSSGSWLSAVVQVFCVDVLLGVDNALLIALVCRSLRREDRVEALVFGAAGAVLFRALLAAGVGLLLRIPLLRLAGGIVLLAIAMSVGLTREPSTGSDVSADGGPTPIRSLGVGVGLVILADAVMSFDNVLAVGAITQGHTALTLVGLAGSVPLVMFGGLLLSRLLERLRLLTTIGAVIVASIAGELAVSDPLIATWAASEAPTWPVVIPALCAAFVAVDAYWRDRATSSSGLTVLGPSGSFNVAPASTPWSRREKLTDRQIGWLIPGLITLGFLLSVLFFLYVVAGQS